MILLGDILFLYMKSASTYFLVYIKKRTFFVDKNYKALRQGRFTMNQKEMEEFWSGDFGTQYIERCKDSSIVSSNIALFSKILSSCREPVKEIIEYGSNIGLSLLALKSLIKLYQTSKKYICICEYYNPTPVEVVYHETGRIYKRDFCGEMMDKYPGLKLVDYGFVYHRDYKFPQDDMNWFLLEK